MVNESLGMTLTSLVSETNHDLLTIPPTQMKVTPLQALQANTSNNVADWVKEFNAETRDSAPNVSDPLVKQRTIPPTAALRPEIAYEDDGATKTPIQRRINIKLTAAVIGLLGGCYVVLTNPDLVLGLIGQ